MVVSRRSFIRRGSLVFLATGISLSSADRIFAHAYEPAPGDDPAPFNYSKATFAPYVGNVFRIFYPNSSNAVTTTLVSVTDIGPVPDQKDNARECFMLKFRGTETLPQNTYWLEHAQLGRFQLFLVPGGKNKQGIYHQAVINRLNG
jgi:hypothetical protein